MELSIHIITITYIFEGDFNASLVYNSADLEGGAIFSPGHDGFTFRNTSEISLNHNTATDIGGALYLCYNSSSVFEGNSKVSFTYV